MILSVHAIFGAAVASVVPSHPVAGFALGFISHLALDAIPHKDYELVSVAPGPNRKIEIINTVFRKFRLLRDMTLVSLDALVGLCLAFIFFSSPGHPWIFLIGAVGALLPDFLTFLYLLLRHKPLGLFFDFHSSFIHSKKILKLTTPEGLAWQFGIVIILIGMIEGVRSLL